MKLIKKKEDNELVTLDGKKLVFHCVIVIMIFNYRMS